MSVAPSRSGILRVFPCLCPVVASCQGLGSLLGCRLVKSPAAGFVSRQPDSAGLVQPHGGVSSDDHGRCCGAAPTAFSGAGRRHGTCRVCPSLVAGARPFLARPVTLAMRLRLPRRLSRSRHRSPRSCSIPWWAHTPISLPSNFTRSLRQPFSRQRVKVAGKDEAADYHLRPYILAAKEKTAISIHCPCLSHLATGDSPN